ncbi:ribokinase [uncultured Clostridium sp.]|jgi:ribokinase|uniref:ribokinase n=1 Tax=uncultured Clostridium sp. TaxID=59620 RepID=UPI00262D2CBD|nr:ribokinase [uncultured Clostridium sp.]
MKKIVVVGSINMDLVVSAKRMPKMGETLMGQEMNYFPGGKGGNQAVAAARIGESVSMIGSVGKDTFGEDLIRQLKLENINTCCIKKEDISTGVATIIKTSKDNSIIVVPGANEMCDKELISSFRQIIKEADVLVTQFEIPTETIKLALSIAKEYKVKTIVNPAPAKDIDKELLSNTDFITPNETEFEIMVGKDLSSFETLEEEMIKWQSENKTRLIVTRGSFGVSYIEEGKIETVPCIEVEVVDTTGAGDTFNGVFACCIAERIEISEAIKFSSLAATISVTKFGAQSGMPTYEELKEAVKLIY